MHRGQTGVRNEGENRVRFMPSLPDFTTQCDLLYAFLNSSVSELCIVYHGDVEPTPGNGFGFSTAYPQSM